MERRACRGKWHSLLRAWSPRALVGAFIRTTLLLALSVAALSTASAETLKEALQVAYKLNPKLDAARATQRATDEEVPRALSGYRPSITGSADAGLQHQTGRAGGAHYTWDSQPRGYEIGVVQPLFRGFRTRNAVSVAEATVRAQWETLRSTEGAVLLEAITAYMDVVRDQAILALRENNVAVLTRDLKSTEDRFAVGEVTRTDVAQAKARRATAVANLDSARATLKTSRATYERVVGHPPSRLVEPGPSSLLPKRLTEAIEISARESPSVVAALYREQAAKFNVDLIRGERLPTVQLEGGYQRRFEPDIDVDAAETTSITGRVQVPFYTGGEVEARVRQAKQTHLQRLQEIQQARTEVQEKAVTAWAQLESAKAAVQSDRSSVEANQIALAGVREEERVGQRTLLDVLNAEQELLNSQVTLVTDRRNLVVASYTVLSTIGRLNAQELRLSEWAYDPEVHYREVRDNWFDTSVTHSDGRRETVYPPRREPQPSRP